MLVAGVRIHRDVEREFLALDENDGARLERFDCESSDPAGRP
jgi:hypothetical protein